MGGLRDKGACAEFFGGWGFLIGHGMRESEGMDVEGVWRGGQSTECGVMAHWWGWECGDLGTGGWSVWESELESELEWEAWLGYAMTRKF